MAKSYSDIVLMLRAGYSREEIDAFPDEDTAPAPAPQAPAPAPQAPAPQAPAPQAAASETPEEPAGGANSQPVQEPSPAPQTAQDGSGDLLAAIKALTAAVQGSNRAAAEMGANIIDPQTAGVNALAGMSNIKFDKGGNT